MRDIDAQLPAYRNGREDKFANGKYGEPRIMLIYYADMFIFMIHNNYFQGSKQRWPCAFLMLGQRRRRWANI